MIMTMLLISTSSYSQNLSQLKVNEGTYESPDQSVFCKLIESLDLIVKDKTTVILDLKARRSNGNRADKLTVIKNINTRKYTTSSQSLTADYYYRNAFKNNELIV